MSYTIPNTGKNLMRELGRDPEPFSHYRHVSANHNHQFQVHNPNRYSVAVVVTIQGGSGDSHPIHMGGGWAWESGEEYYNKNNYNKWRYTHAGRTGNALHLHHAGALRLAVGGGAGTQGGHAVMNYVGYRYKGCGDKHSHTVRDWHWSGSGVGRNARQEGEVAQQIIELKPNDRLYINVLYYGAHDAPFKGAYMVSGFC